MPAPKSPPRSYTGSPPLGRHPSPPKQNFPVPYPSQHSQETPHLTVPPTTTSSSSVPSPGPLYSQTSSPSIPDPPNYPPIYSDRPQPVFNNTPNPAAMAPSTATVRTAALGFDLAPTSTPTGRISKAKKGKRVHACEYPGCGKVFTRAEHRRRHELNHNPDATYQCRQSGCNKSFHRLDLLQRHEERHEQEATGAPQQHRRYPSQNSTMSEPPSSMPVTTMTSPAMADNAPRSGAGGMSITSLVHPTSQHQHFHDMSGGFMQGVPYLQPWNSEPSLYYGSDTSPMASRYGGHRQSVSSASSVTEFNVSGSPMVSASMPSQWMPGTAPPNALSADMFGDEYISSNAAPPMPIPLSDLDGYEWSIIRRELSTVPGLFPSAGGAGVPDTVRWHCLELYWQYFHPSFPIVHRPTFLPAKPSPLLASAMVAIGSFYDDREDSKNYSLALLGIAIKILRGRPNITSRSRIVDLQTVVLLEILGTFYARQISVQMSTRFRALFANLHQAQHWLTSPLAVFRTLKDKYTAAELSKAHKFFVEHETRSRILHACTVLDHQQAQLFEQPHTIRRHNGLRLNVATAQQTYHLPCDDELWNASPVEHWAQLAKGHEYTKLVQGVPASPKSPTEFSFFQSQVVVASDEQAVSKASTGMKYRSLPPTDGFSNQTFNYHVSEMCKHTPVRSLLIVTGESWLLGRKVEKQAEYSQAKQELRKWLNSATATRRVNIDSLVAQWHALAILRGLMNLKASEATQVEVFGTTYMMHENWSVYLACLICWAHSRRKTVMDATGIVPAVMQVSVPTHDHGHVSDDAFSTPNTVTFAASPSQAALEAESYLMFSETSTALALRDLGANVLLRVQGLIETVRRQKIAAHMMGGLMNDAEQVLFKLVEGKTRINF